MSPSWIAALFVKSHAAAHEPFARPKTAALLLPVSRYASQRARTVFGPYLSQRSSNGWTQHPLTANTLKAAMTGSTKGSASVIDALYPLSRTEDSLLQPDALVIP